MGDCVNCGRALDVTWKYCIYCGHSVGDGASARPAMLPTAHDFAPEFPPDDDVEVDVPRKRADVLLILGVALGIAGIVLIVYMVAVLRGPV
ncbi:MAG: zinc ribbon domain-containing protein [Burkholderiaceae bacterium]|nr:zinc ribbon domain-containing protein [Microbacteriaceae bacterium]